MRESFRNAEVNDHEDETPQYGSIPADLGELLNLFGNMEDAYLAVDGIVIDDDNLGSSEGNGDGVIDYAETIELTVALHNMGLSDAENVVGTLTSVSPYVTMIVDVANYGNILSEATGTNSPPFVFMVDDDIPDGESLALVLQIPVAPGEISLGLSAAGPSYAATVSMINDSGEDGMADPGEDVSLTLRIENRGSSDTPSLSAVLQGGGYFDVNGASHAVGVIPSGESVDVSGFSVHVSELCPEIYTGHLTLDLTGPASYEASADVFLMVGPWFDTVETDLGWTLGVADDDATTGLWERTDPNGTEYDSQAVQPEDDHTTAPGHICFVTGNGAVGGSAGANDIDGGKTTLLSPIFNLEGATSATLSYWRWYTNDLGNNPGQDYWDVDVNSGGLGWVPLEHTMVSDNSWTEQIFDLSSYIIFTDEVRFRFVAADEDANSLVEAAVDDIMVTIVRAPVTGVEDAGDALSYRFRLDPCVPNPMNPSTQISFELPTDGPATLRVYDVGGRLVRTLLDGSNLKAGPQVQNWDGRNGSGLQVASGVYFVCLQTPRAEITRSVTLLK